METLKSIIQQGEHQQLDFKFRIDDAKKIARTLSAFANTDGGRLLIGVKDNGKITGVDPSEEIHMIDAAVDMYCKPKLPFESRVWQEDMKLVLEITIQPSAEKPVTSPDEDGKWRVYVRRKDHTLLANKILLNVWKQEKRQNARPEKFGEEETRLLGVIAENEPVTLSKIYRLSDLPKNRVDHLMVLFVCWKLVRMEISEQGTFYSIIE
ncbi:MAG TPA: ATP-binding protein [Fluviicola sp.]|nr:ATP-binding protein [Fluviicola sp.]